MNFITGHWPQSDGLVRGLKGLERARLMPLSGAFKKCPLKSY